MDKKTKKYHDNMTRVMKMASTNHVENIRKHEEHLGKIKKEGKREDENSEVENPEGLDEE